MHILEWIIVIILVLSLVMLVINANASPLTTIKGGAKKIRFPPKIISLSRKWLDKNVLDYGSFETAGEVSNYSSLMPWHVEDVDNTMKTIFPVSPKTITDMTAHIGADSVNFLKLFPNAEITSVELNPKVGMILKRNMKKFTKILNINSSQSHVIIGDANEKIVKSSRILSEFTYIDPPWNDDRSNLQLGSDDITTVIKNLLIKAKEDNIIVIKLPKETNLDNFDSRVGIKSTRFPIRNIQSNKISYHLLLYVPHKLL